MPIPDYQAATRRSVRVASPARMAADTPPSEGAPAPPRECSACRGTGRVISNLGGSPQEVACPWCEGTGRFIPGHDAQAPRRAEGAGGAGDSGGAADSRDSADSGDSGDS
jgi:DnaJ-class molecular chaperone